MVATTVNMSSTLFQARPSPRWLPSIRFWSVRLRAKLRRAAELCELCVSVVVMSDRAREFLNKVYGVPHFKIEVIPHGVPDSDGVRPPLNSHPTLPIQSCSVWPFKPSKE